MHASDTGPRRVTHEVTNQPAPFVDVNLYDRDPALAEALKREGGAWAEERVRDMGAFAGSARALELAEQANRYPPELRAYDKFGNRIDEVAFHPAYHALMSEAIGRGIHSVAWTRERRGGHVVHTALEYLYTQAEAGTCCPVTMTYASLGALKHQPEIDAEWRPRIVSAHYDPRMIPAKDKAGATIGMAMTEKQGGSDVRANTTRAAPLGHGGPGAEYALTGHKWFCSAPMCDAFLTLAYTGKGLTCFFVPRWKPDGTRNAFFVMRLKDKLGNRSNASAEIEYDGTWARMVGEEGRGVRTILDMVHHTRLDTALAAAGYMRQALNNAMHHTAHRTAFQKRLIDQPAMMNVLADLTVEAEAATTLVMRVARAYDEGEADDQARAFARLAVALAKYWINRRAPTFVFEAMEAHGGAGYVEESVMPRLFRESPLNSIWEGSGNVIALDILRTLAREPEAVEAYLAEVEPALGADRRFDAAVKTLKQAVVDHGGHEGEARRLGEALALVLQGSLLLRHGPAAIADAFCASRLGGDWGFAFGTLPSGVDLRAVIDRVRPPA